MIIDIASAIPPEIKEKMKAGEKYSIKARINEGDEAAQIMSIVVLDWMEEVLYDGPPRDGSDGKG